MGAYSSTPLCLSFSTIQPLMQTNIYAKHRMPEELHRRQTETGGTCACHCTARRWRRKSSGLLTTTGIGSGDTMWDIKEGFPALPFAAQLVLDNKSQKLDRHRLFAMEDRN